MPKIPWIHPKKISFADLETLLQPSLELNQLTNYGPLVVQLETYLRDLLHVEADRAVIVVVNGALALHALTSGIEIVDHQVRRYATSAYTFPCSAQGPLATSQILDVTPDGFLDVTALEPDVTGLIITNLFGHLHDLSAYSAEIVIYDNATTPWSFYQGKNAVNYGTGCILSLHHTKPIGFAEGGIIVVEKKYELGVRQCLNFGFSLQKTGLQWKPQGTNGKMSEVTAGCHLLYLKAHAPTIFQHQAHLHQTWRQLITAPFRLLGDQADQPGVVSCLAVICPTEITNDDLYQLELLGITARKYYTPLVAHPEAKRLFQQIVCFPCHLGVTTEDLQHYHGWLTARFSATSPSNNN